MKELLARLIGESESPLMARNVMREYLQARVLACLQREGAARFPRGDGTALSIRAAPAFRGSRLRARG